MHIQCKTQQKGDVVALNRKGNAHKTCECKEEGCPPKIALLQVHTRILEMNVQTE